MYQQFPVVVGKRIREQNVYVDGRCLGQTINSGVSSGICRIMDLQSQFKVLA
jgi:hypothetical protein